MASVHVNVLVVLAHSFTYRRSLFFNYSLSPVSFIFYNPSSRSIFFSKTLSYLLLTITRPLSSPFSTPTCLNITSPNHFESLVVQTISSLAHPTIVFPSNGSSWFIVRFTNTREFDLRLDSGRHTAMLSSNDVRNF